MIRAWHFVGKTLRDGSPIPPDGEWLEFTGKLKMCVAGLHASRDPFDALQYAPGETLCFVECGVKVIEGADKLVCSRRRIVARMDATEMLRYFARMQALSVVHLWAAPDVVLDYLMTGDESIRAAARAAAAWDAARDAASDAAWDAARDAAAWDAARDAARAAAARDAARAAARAAAARDAASDAAAWDAARAAASDAAAWDAARAAARSDFNALVHECFEAFL